MTQTPNPDARGINERLADYRELLSQFEAVRARLRRAEEERQTVPRRVYEKVRAEYDHQLDALRARMTPLRDELDGVRHRYEEELKDAIAALETVEEELAELTFRHRIGELTDEGMVTPRAEIETRLDAARARISATRETVTAMENAAPQSGRAGEPSTPVTPPPATGSETITPIASEMPVAAPREMATPVTQTPPAPESKGVAPAASEAPVAVRRPVLRVDAPEEAPKPRFENPHDWIDEFGSELKPAEKAPARAPHPAPKPVTAPEPAPAPAPPSLVFVSGPHAGQSIPLLHTTLTIGREHDNNIEIKDGDVARYHARILNDRGAYVVEDMASATGTWVNGTRTQRATLGHGDVIRIGQTEIAVDFEWASNSLQRAGIDPAA